MMRGILGLIAFMAMCLSTACAVGTLDAAAPNNWRTECVGRYQLSVPGNVDVALDKLTELGTSTDASYTDGQITPFAKLDYSGGISIISPAAEADFVRYKNIVLENTNNTRQLYIHSKREERQKWAQEMKNLAYDTPTMFGWDSEDRYPRISYFRDNKIFSYSPPHFDGRDNSQNVKHFNSFLKDFRARALFEVPKEPGVCIPYGFIPDDGAQPHEIAVAMRLKDHPDVEVALRDATYQGRAIRDGKHTAAYLDPKEAINEFFNYSGILNRDEDVKGSLFGLHSVEMNGQKGGAISVTITRADGSKDYGYVAAVQGSADTPGLLLYVIRTASLAKGKPVSEGELKDMAVKIVASVKRHAVQ